MNRLKRVKWLLAKWGPTYVDAIEVGFTSRRGEFLPERVFPS